MPVEWIKISAHYDVIKKKLGEKWNKNRFPIIISLMIKPADSEKANWSALTLHRNGSANIEREEKRERAKSRTFILSIYYSCYSSKLWESLNKRIIKQICDGHDWCMCVCVRKLFYVLAKCLNERYIYFRRHVLHIYTLNV